MSFRYICVAGTFDGLHKGHEALLTKAFEVGEKVLIGLTSDEFISRFKSPKVLRYSIRKRKLHQWLEIHGYLNRARIVPINDPFEPAASDPALEAIVVSEDSKARGEELNAIRITNKRTALQLIVVPMVAAEDRKPISASRVRGREIDRNGRLIMPDSLRIELAKPLGPVHFSFKRPGLSKLIITIGDVTTKTFLDAGIIPGLMIVDNKVNRLPFSGLKPIFATHTFPIKKVSSGPGFIAREAVRLIQKWAQSPHETLVIEVHGEEDLLTLPVVVQAPIGAAVYYGQPDRGVVEVIVTKQSKQKAQSLLQKFL